MNMIRTRRFFLLALAGLFGLLPATQAANKARAKSPGPAVGARFDNLRERLKEVANDLKLTDAQRAKLRPILRAELEKLKAVREDKAHTRREKIAKLQAIREDTLSQIKGVLTPKQWKKWEKSRTARRRSL
jgi:periplasmic protein CpxP/Spy